MELKRTGPSKYPRRGDHVVWKVIDGKGILLNLESGAYFEVDPVGLSIWHQCDGRTTMEGMAQAVASEFRARVERVQEDLPAFVAELKRRNLVEIAPTSTPAKNRP